MRDQAAVLLTLTAGFLVSASNMAPGLAAQSISLAPAPRAAIEPARQPMATSLAAAESALRQAAEADRRKDPVSVDHYAWAAILSWPGTASADDRERATRLYQDSLAKLMAGGVKYQRLDLQKGLDLNIPGRAASRIVVRRSGFVWQAEDFSEYQLAATLNTGKLERYWSEPGIGVPLAVIRRRKSERDFHGKDMPFAATVVLRPDSRATAGAWRPGTVVGVLELYDPLRVSELEVGSSITRLARDTSAPWCLVLRDMNRDNWQDFLRPGREDAVGGLRLLEPYQAGRIPIVLVHGLLSDKFTWVPLINDLRAQAWINARFQIWTFQYPTGRPFLQSGASLRQTLRDIAAVYDPRGADPAQQQFVLIGHSMGGLISKLQITYSGQILWNQVASRPFSEVRAAPQQLDAVHKMFFFDPVPTVKRVVYVGTPHLGSFWAQSLYGRLGASLVRMPRDGNDLLNSLLKNNPQVFNDALKNGIPTSVDLLKPDSPLLIGMTQLPSNPAVKFHTIAGNGTPFSDGTPADGVVSIDSARHPGASSECFVNAGHSDLPDHRDTTAEIVRILREHLQQLDAVYPIKRP